jgi:cell wall-associated NlpC family hydrolase
VARGRIAVIGFLTRDRVRPATTALLLAVTAIVLVGWFDAAHARPHRKVYKARRQIEKRARKELGTPYVYGGSSPGGFDCSGFTRWVFTPKASLPHSAASQLALPGYGSYRKIWKVKNLETGDLVFFDTTSARVGHVGIFVGHGKFIHASSSHGVRIDSIHDPYYYAPRFVAAVRVPALRTRGHGHSH